MSNQQLQRKGSIAAACLGLVLLIGGAAPAKGHSADEGNEDKNNKIEPNSPAFETDFSESPQVELRPRTARGIGTDTDNGGLGRVYEPKHGFDQDRVTPHRWCSRAHSVFDQIYSWARRLRKSGTTPLGVRRFLVGEIAHLQQQMNSYMAPVSPASAAILSLARRVEREFPAVLETNAEAVEHGSSAGNRVANMVMIRLLEAARKANRQYEELNEYSSFFRSSTQFCQRHLEECRQSRFWRNHKHFHSEEEYDLAPFFESHISAVGIALEKLFNPVDRRRLGMLPESLRRSNLFDYMKYDSWEVDASQEIMKWIKEQMQSDLLRRHVVCTIAQMERSVEKIEQWKNKTWLQERISPEQMRFSARQELYGVHLVFQEGSPDCRYSED